ncbi:hypothetical protein COCNU_09G002660 [Cocos nucifera]|uniref:Uncharacterized protein n=1 Tax=Cocos nucifera TaxID=13894 RepID=A0A8K0IJF1_COCNU|nr:hypothetical protein COCNU_09G002660 [Cocos nucifera]
MGGGGGGGPAKEPRAMAGSGGGGDVGSSGGGRQGGGVGMREVAVGWRGGMEGEMGIDGDGDAGSGADQGANRRRGRRWHRLGKVREGWGLIDGGE